MMMFQLHELYNFDCEGKMFIKVSTHKELKEGKHDTHWKQCPRIKL